MNVVYYPVDGGWTDWSDWLPCSTSCGRGHSVKHRQCTNPQPQHGGRDCGEENVQFKACQSEPCLGKFHTFLVLGAYLQGHNTKYTIHSYISCIILLAYPPSPMATRTPKTPSTEIMTLSPVIMHPT